MQRYLLSLAAVALLVGCTFNVDKPENFKTVDPGEDTVQDAVGDIGTPDLKNDLPEGTCTKASDCPVPEDPCFKASCKDGECGSVPNQSAVCDDGDPCTEDGACNAQGKCMAGDPVLCEDDDPDDCFEMICTQEAGKCVPSEIAGCLCHEVGGVFVDGEGKCCDAPNLNAVPHLQPMEQCPPDLAFEECCEGNGDERICLFCGNGECEMGENFCNCPEDCLFIEPMPCSDFENATCYFGMECPGNEPVPEGICPDEAVCCAGEANCLGPGDIGAVNGPMGCCEGLEAIEVAAVMETGDCEYGQNKFVCTLCGNGACNVGQGENHCNCEQDCPKDGCNTDGQCDEGQTCFNGNCTYCKDEICNGLDDDCDGFVDNDCKEVCFAEICGDQKDNDCDGVFDEGVCVTHWCTNMPVAYTPVTLHDLVSSVDQYLGTPVAVSGRVNNKEAVCVGEDCQWDLVLEEQGIAPPTLTIGPSQAYPEVYCYKKDVSLKPDTCIPLDKGGNYIVWGTLQKTGSNDVSGAVLQLDGFCKP